MLLPASHTLVEPPHIADGAINPEGARTPSIGECDGPGCLRRDRARSVTFGYGYLGP